MPYFVKKDPSATPLRHSMHFWNYIWQPISAMIFIWVLLYIMDKVTTNEVLWASGSAALAATTFMIFVMPENPAARWYRIILGYAIAIGVGEGMRIAFTTIFHSLPQFAGIPYLRLFEVGAVLSFAGIIIVMSVFRVPHPPAAGFGVVMVIETKSWAAIVVVAVAVVILMLLKFFLRDMLVNLV